MKVLLIGEASGVHRNLKKGLVELGVECLHMTQSASSSWKWYDDTFSPDYSGVLGGVLRNVSPFYKIARLDDYDVINFTNTITTVHGTYSRYYDIPLLRRKAKLMSYYALGCDEIGLIRHNEALPYSPCRTCLASGDTLSRDCEEILNPRYEASQAQVRRHFDFGASCMVEYGHVQDLFGANFANIPFPVDVQLIPFSPAKPRTVTNIVHTPTRRGFKGTDVVLNAIEILTKKRTDFSFKIIEGLSYPDYIEAMKNADVVVDQVYSQSPGMNGVEMLAAGKIVMTGATALGKSYFDFAKHTPAFDASPDPALLAAQLSEVLDRKDEFPAMAEGGRAYIEEHHSVQAVAGMFLKEWSSRL
ncbi:MAG: hypothetical protein P4M15_03740 [Alphaproteobacteria bacterium]|nr:hypothetical protein [Alphaproteobacteria bacterium]